MKTWENDIRAYRSYIANQKSNAEFFLEKGLQHVSPRLMNRAEQYYSNVPVYEMLQVVNGQAEKSNPLLLGSFWLMDEDHILSHLDMGSEYHEIQFGVSPSPSNAVKPYIWTESWFPFAMDGFGEVLCIDFDPAVNGVFGQVIKIWHDSENKLQLAPSLCHFLKSLKDI